MHLYKRRVRTIRVERFGVLLVSEFLVLGPIPGSIAKFLSTYVIAVLVFLVEVTPINGVWGFIGLFHFIGFYWVIP